MNTLGTLNLVVCVIIEVRRVDSNRLDVLRNEFFQEVHRNPSGWRVQSYEGVMV